MAERIRIFDTTLRDGEQSPGATMNIKEKLRLAHQLQTLGVDIIEAGFPAASPGDFESVRAIAKTVKGMTVAGLCRALPAEPDNQVLRRMTAWIFPEDAPRLNFLRQQGLLQMYRDWCEANPSCRNCSLHAFFKQKERTT